jgi:hypothetical protein
MFFDLAVGVSALKWLTEELVNVASSILVCGRGRFINDGLDINVCKKTIFINIFLNLSSFLVTDSLA